MEHRHLPFTEGCVSVGGALILSLILPEAPVVSGHVTEMAGDPSTGVFGLGRDFSLAHFHWPSGPCLNEHAGPSSVSHPGLACPDAGC